MDDTYALKNSDWCQGIDISCTDGSTVPPETTKLDGETAAEWFADHPTGDCPAIRLLSLTVRDVPSSIPFTRGLVEKALWKPNVYSDLARTRAGGCAAMLDNPFQFALQTPIGDDGPFVSVALSCRGIVVKGTYLFNDDIFDPRTIIKNETIMSGWRSSSMHIISVPHAIVRAQSAWLTRRIENVSRTVSDINKALAQEPVGGAANHINVHDFSGFSRSIQSCSSVLTDLERRSRWEVQILDAIETVTARARHGTVPWPALAPLRAAISTRQFDFETLPLCIASARATISNLIQQGNERMNLEIARETHRIAEATLSESASMKTIAVLTMVFLPGTAVASFFSMGFFNWSGDGGSGLTSQWLWIFFVVAVPMSAMVLLIWWVWTRRTERTTLQRYRALAPVTRATTFHDEENVPPPTGTDEDDVEMQDVRVDAKVVK